MKPIHYAGIAIVVIVAVVWRSIGTMQAVGTAIPSVSEIRSQEALSDAFPVFRETVYRIEYKRKVGVFSVDKTTPVLASGSGFLLKTQQGIFVVTARHVAEGPSKLAEIRVDNKIYQSDSDGYDTITKIGERIRLSGKSIRPASIWLDRSTDGRLDLAIMSIEEPNFFNAKPLKPAKAKKGEAVELYGFPAKTVNLDDEVSDEKAEIRATANLARRSQTITSLERNYFVTEGTEPASSGFSGGPVLNDDGEVVGMIIRSMGVQTRCIYIDTILDAVKRFQSDSVKYAE